MSLQQLKQELKQNLEHKGTLNQVRANLRASIFQVLTSASPEERLPTKQSQSQILLHLLIIDYLKWIGYKFTASTFEQEASLGSEQEFSRDFLAKEIGMPTPYADKDIPVLYSLMQKIVREQKGERGLVQVTDSLENLKEAWLRHEKEDNTTEDGEVDDEETVVTQEETTYYEEYSTDLEGAESTATAHDNNEEEDESSEEDEESQLSEQAFVLKR